jgi:hypothetical protein
MNVVGNWNLHFDFGCVGESNHARITFNADGTLVTDDVPPAQGRWSAHDGQILFQFARQPAAGFRPTYGGTVVGSAMIGSFVVENETGCWLAFRPGAIEKAKVKRRADLAAVGTP